MAAVTVAASANVAPNPSTPKLTPSISRSSLDLTDRPGPIEEGEQDALWLHKPAGKTYLLPANVKGSTPPKGYITVKSQTIGVTRQDWQKRESGANRFLSWKKTPTVLGSNVAGTVFKVAPGDLTFTLNERVVGHAQGMSNKNFGSQTRAFLHMKKKEEIEYEGALQRYVRLRTHMTSKVPEGTNLEDIVVAPLALSTAACALFQKRHLGLPLLRKDDSEAKDVSLRKVILIWGARSSVGRNAAQLADDTGYEVWAVVHQVDPIIGVDGENIYTYVQKDAMMNRLRTNGRNIVGAISVGQKAAERLSDILQVIKAAKGRNRLAIVTHPMAQDKRSSVEYKACNAAARSAICTKAFAKFVHPSFVDSGSLAKDEPLARHLYHDWLPNALRDNRYIPTPEKQLFCGTLKLFDGACDYVWRQEQALRTDKNTGEYLGSFDPKKPVICLTHKECTRHRRI